jgi:type IV pilus assembly protein PilC
MPNYAYVARTHSGQEMTGVLSGPNVDQVVDELHRQGLIVLHVADDALLRRRPVSLRRLLATQTAFGGVGTRDLALFTRQMATLVQTGIPLVRGLRGLAMDGQNRTLGRTVAKVAETVEQGHTLAEALSQHPRVFNKLYVSMIRAGEGAGTLDQILEELASYLEKVDAIKTKVRSAMAYPIFVLCFAIAATIFLLLKVVPMFEEIYASFDSVLPAPTLALMSASRFVRDHILLTGALLAGLLVLFAIWVRTPGGRLARDSFLISMPIFGPIIKKATISRMNRTLGILLRSGLPVLDALELTKGAAGNEALSRAVAQVKDRVGRGEELTHAFRSTKRIPEMVLQLMATGEESGQMDSMLIKSSEFYDRQVEASVQGLTSLIEPLLIVVVGAIVGIVVVSMFLPVFYLGDAVMKGAY